MNKKNAILVNYLYVYSVRNASGKLTYIVRGDDAESTTKKECAKRIRNLCKAGKMDANTRNYLLKNLHDLKVR